MDNSDIRHHMLGWIPFMFTGTKSYTSHPYTASCRLIAWAAISRGESMAWLWFYHNHPRSHESHDHGKTDLTLGYPPKCVPLSSTVFKGAFHKIANIEVHIFCLDIACREGTRSGLGCVNFGMRGEDP